MKQLFESATLKLTGWYLLILMIISIIFSVAIYDISTTELGARLGIFQDQVEIFSNVPGGAYRDFDAIRTDQLHQSEGRLFLTLFYANVAILALGGIVSYLLARRSLQPIERAHEAVSRFTSDASHELRTPLAVMKSELEVALRDNDLTKSDMREVLESNLEEVNRLSNLSHMLLQISRHDYAELKIEKFNLGDLAKASLNVLNKQKNRIELDAPKKAITISANRASMSELLMIILDNALRYSPEDSKVHLKLKDSEQGAHIIVSNKGKGISAADLPHVFERFYRGDKSRTTGDAAGYGLGLSLAKKIVELHDGTIEITSVPDKDTTVTIFLPQSS